MRAVKGDTAGSVPETVRYSFAVFVAAAVLSLLNAVYQLSNGLSGALVLVGAGIEASLFLVLGSQMRIGKLWARMALMAFAWVFVALGVLFVVGLFTGPTGPIGGQELVAAIGYLAKIVLIVIGTVLMYRSESYGYFR